MYLELYNHLMVLNLSVLKLGFEGSSLVRVEIYL